jgi:tRNA(Ile)-lysidine synthase
MDVPERVRAGGLLPDPGGRAIVTMLSGGRDSVCLLDVAVSLCGAEQVHALHVNYGLREEAEGDERHCGELCAALGVDLQVVRAGRPLGNVQAWAREVRYEAAGDLAEKHDALVAAGHTATDQVETILYRLAASPGRRALLGMPARDGRLIRPLLGVTREQTAAHCVERGLRWREDASNESDRYARGRVRAMLVPALRAVHPAAEANVLRTAELLREETALLEDLVDGELTHAGSGDGSPAAPEIGAGGEARIPGSSDSIAIERLAELHPALARLLVIRLAEQAAGSDAYVPQAGDRVGEILELAARQPRAELHIGGLVSAVIEAGRVHMVAIAPHFVSPKSER